MQENFILQTKAASVARLAPREWGELINALAAYVEIQRNNLVNSGLPELPVNQGRAQFGTSLVLLLGNCMEADDKAREAQRKAMKP